MIYTIKEGRKKRERELLEIANGEERQGRREMETTLPRAEAGERDVSEARAGGRQLKKQKKDPLANTLH